MTTVVDVDKPVLSLALRLRPRSVVDVASGYGHWLWYYTRWSFGSLSEAVNGVAVDLFSPYLKDIQKWNDYVVRASACCLPFRDKVFDLAFFVDGPEHLQKADGCMAIMEVRRVSKECVVATPQVFELNPAAEGNVGNRHQSVWSGDELRSYGFYVSKAGSEYVASTVPPLPFAVRLRRRIIPLRLRVMLKHKGEKVKNALCL